VETWHYVAIGAVVVIGGVWYVRRRNKAKAAEVGAPKKKFNDPRYEKSVGERGINALIPGYGSKEKLDQVIKGEEIDKGGGGYLPDEYLPKNGKKSEAVKGSY
jgi:hypothetical protein